MATTETVKSCITCCHIKAPWRSRRGVNRGYCDEITKHVKAYTEPGGMASAATEFVVLGSFCCQLWKKVQA